MAPFSGGGRVTGTLKDLQVDQTLSTPFQADVNALLHEPLYELSFDSRVRFSGLNPRRIRADLPELPGERRDHGQGDVRGSEEHGDGARRGRAGRPGAGLLPAGARGGDLEDRDRPDRAAPGRPPASPPTARSSWAKRARWTSTARPNWRNVSWPLRGSKPMVASRRGSATHHRRPREVPRPGAGRSLRRLDAARAAGPWPARAPRSASRSSRSKPTSSPAASPAAARWPGSPTVRWNAVLRGDGLDPRSFSAQFPGSVSFAANSRGRMSDAGPVGQVQVSNLSGNLRGQPLRGDRLGCASPAPAISIDRLDLAWSNATAKASGWVGDSLDLAWSVDAPNLGVAIPQGGGALVAQGRVSGSAKAPRIQATAQGRGLTSGANSVAEADLTADVEPRAGRQRRARPALLRHQRRRAPHRRAHRAGPRTAQQPSDRALRPEQGGPGGPRPGRRAGVHRPPGAARSASSTCAPSAPATGAWRSRRLSPPRPTRSASTASAGARATPSSAPTAAGPRRRRLERRLHHRRLPDQHLPALPAHRPGDHRRPQRHRWRRAGRGAVLASADVDLRPGPGELRFPGAEGRTLAFRYTEA